VCHPRGGVG